VARRAPRVVNGFLRRVFWTSGRYIIKTKPYFGSVRLSDIERLVVSGVRYFARDIYPTLGLLTTAGLLAAAVVLYLFAGLAEEVLEGDTRRFDRTALALLNRFASPPLTSFMRGMTWLGSNVFLIVAGAFVVLSLALARLRRGIVALLVAMAGATLLNIVLKLAFRRERPEPFFDTPLPESYSFPSGHALLSFCFYGIIAAVITARIEGIRWRAFVWVGAALLVALIGLSRIYLGVHYPSDVAAGYAAGFVWVLIVASADRVMEARFRQKNYVMYF
jgi:undecaprenyl-diphosphatase